jgi:hypothetical protein
MFRNLKVCLSLLLLVVSLPALAAKDPVSWALTGSFPNPVVTQTSYAVTYTFTNQLPVKMVKAIVINKVASPANEFSYVDNCSGLFLNSQQSCTVQITLVPNSSGQKSVQLIITGYSKDQVLVPALLASTFSNGISASSNVTGIVSQSFPNTLTVGSPASYSFTFTNAGSSDATGVSIQSTDSSLVSHCGTLLKAAQSCTASGTYTPVSISPAIQTVSATFNYINGTPVTVSTSTNVPQATGVVGFLVSPNLLPAAMLSGASYKVQMKYQNYGPTDTAVVTSDPSTMIVQSGGTGSIGTFTLSATAGDNSCTTGLPLGVNGACIATGTFTATGATSAPFVLTGSLTYTGVTGSPTVVTATTNVATSLPTTRSVKFTNNCTFPVYFSLSGGQLNGASCTGGATCPTGTACDSTNGNCYWTNYAPIDNNFQLASGGGTETVSIPATAADPNIQWSGAMSASLNCAPGGCAQADCSNSTGSTVTACSPGIGFTPPVTQAEFTMNLSKADAYDVEVINGYTIPVAVTPTPYVTASNYNCGTPGNAVAANGFGACNWASATPPSVAYYRVTSSTTHCSAKSDCASTQLCGLDDTFAFQMCGNFLGYWSADEACGKNATAADPFFNCNTPVTGQFYPANTVLSELMLCKVPAGSISPTFNSCYLTYNGDSTSLVDTCCGCVDWWTSGVSGANSNAQSCTQVGAASPQANPTWLSSIQTQVEWLKLACPSDYVYPFDDKTSGFSCTNNLPAATNTVGYNVTFCPATGTAANDSGLPGGTGSGLTDGR